MNDIALGTVIALFAFLLVLGGYQLCNLESVGLDELRDSGYDVVRHSETHGGFHTNWVEVVRKEPK